MAEQQGVERVFIHAILDGRDTPPASARPHLESYHKRSLERQKGYIATICGRYYAMDRDRRWERTEKAYRAYVYGEGRYSSDPLQALEEGLQPGAKPTSSFSRW